MSDAIEGQKICRQFYLDIYQRLPTKDDVIQFSQYNVSDLNSLLERYRVGMHSPEFLERFVLNNSPRMLARIIANQLLRRNPVDQIELDEIANSFIANTWNNFLISILSNREVQNKLVEELKTHTTPATAR